MSTIWFQSSLYHYYHFVVGWCTIFPIHIAIAIAIAIDIAIIIATIIPVDTL
jgi:hypothetical protein